jgi:hypothetical protein
MDKKASDKPMVQFDIALKLLTACLFLKNGIRLLPGSTQQTKDYFRYQRTAYCL